MQNIDPKTLFWKLTVEEFSEASANLTKRNMSID